MGSGDHHSLKSMRYSLVWWSKICLGFLGGGRGCIGREEDPKPEQIPGLDHRTATEITRVTSLVLQNQSGVDESTHMMEGRAIFRHGLPSEVPKELKVAETPEETSNQSPTASLCSTQQQKPARCRSQRSHGSAGVPTRDPCPPTSPAARQSAQHRPLASLRKKKQ